MRPLLMHPNTHPGCPGNLMSLQRSKTEDALVVWLARNHHNGGWFCILCLHGIRTEGRWELMGVLMQVLFDTLKYHGASFTAPFWARVFDSVLLPIFDHVRAEVCPAAMSRLFLI